MVVSWIHVLALLGTGYFREGSFTIKPIISSPKPFIESLSKALQ